MQPPALPPDSDHCACAQRRRFLQQTATLGLGVVAAGALSGCSLLDDKEVVAGTVTQIAQKGYLTAQLNDARVFVGRLPNPPSGAQPSPDAYYALDLTCTHKGCTVEYQPDQAQFKCPCHKGRYRATGEVLEGKPPAPLARLAVEVRGQDIVVLNQPLG